MFSEEFFSLALPLTLELRCYTTPPGFWEKLRAAGQDGIRCAGLELGMS